MFLSVAFLLIAGCVSSPTGAPVVCNKPYIIVGNECCLDQNNNSICDNDEPAQKEELAKEVICNKPYILVGTKCCLDKNNNLICDNEETVEDNTQQNISNKGKTTSEALDSVITIISKLSGKEPIGSGFIVSEDGYILTNFHVVYDAYVVRDVWYDDSSISAKTLDSKTYPLEFVGANVYLDFAILKVKEPDRKFKYLEISKDSGKIGDVVYALGAPFGEEFSVTKGIISQKNRPSYLDELSEEDKYKKYLQLDAAINPGNSGGPIVNENGKVVGMSTYIMLESEGLGYGLQSEEIKALYEDGIYKNMSLVKDRYTDAVQRLSKDVIISNKGAALVTRRDTGEASFRSFGLSIDNQKSTPINVCYHADLMDYFGLKEYNEDLKHITEVNANSNKAETIYTNLKFKSDVQLFYRINVFDCTSKEKYGVMYGLGSYAYQND